MAGPDSSAPPDTQDDDLFDRPYHSKRPHKKSRKGCVNCKTRKVKCDEARPACRSCRLRKVTCVYSTPAESRQQPPPSRQTDSRSSGSSSKSPDSSPETERLATPTLDSATTTLVTHSGFNSLPIQGYETGYGADFGMFDALGIVAEPLFVPQAPVDNLDMKLLWFYTTATCESFNVDDGGKRHVEDIMKSTIVRYAFENTFLMNTLFALASLHMQTLDQQIDPNQSLSYRARSFQGYRTAIEEGDPKTFPALLANSLLLCAISSQSFRDPSAPPLYIIEWMVVWKGIGLMFDLVSKPVFFTSGLEALFRRPPIDLEKSAVAIPNSLLFMVSSIKPDDPDFNDMDLLYTTLKYLGSLYLNLDKEGFTAVMNLRFITWFTFIPPAFMSMCRERRPRALVIVAYYSAFLKLIQSVWWTVGIGQRSLQDICDYLDSDPVTASDWQIQDLLRVPRAVLASNNRIEMGRILYGNPAWQPPDPDPKDVSPSAIYESLLGLVDDRGRAVEMVSTPGSEPDALVKETGEHPFVWEQMESLDVNYDRGDPFVQPHVPTRADTGEKVFYRGKYGVRLASRDEEHMD